MILLVLVLLVLLVLFAPRRPETPKTVPPVGYVFITRDDKKFAEYLRKNRPRYIASSRNEYFVGSFVPDGSVISAIVRGQPVYRWGDFTVQSYLSV
jgi:hypothetical protein